MKHMSSYHGLRVTIHMGVNKVIPIVLSKIVLIINQVLFCLIVNKKLIQSQSNTLCILKVSIDTLSDHIRIVPFIMINGWSIIFLFNEIV